MRSVTGCILLFVLGCPAPGLAQAPIVYATAGSVYTQNFDGLPNAGIFTLAGKGPLNLSGPPIDGTNLAGWQLLMTGGTNTNAAFAVSTGSSTGNGVYSLGASASTDRALGSLSSGSGIYSIGLVFTNNTGGPLNSFTVSFTTEQWRKGGSANKNTWSFRYKTGILTGIDQPVLIDDPNLDMASVIATSGAASLNGNLPENQKTVNFTVHGLNWKNSEQLLLRWDDADEGGNDDVCGMDNFSFSAALLSTAPTVVTNPATSIGPAGAILNATVNDNFSATAVAFEYDSTNTFSNITTLTAAPANIAAGSGNTSVSATVTGLSPGRIYFFRAKAVNTTGNTSGAILNFTTALILPVVTTGIATGVTTSTATLGGNAGSSGGSSITERGIVWSPAINPTLLNNKITMGNGTGNFMQTISALPQGSTIYARAYATSAAGTAYGSNELFTTQTSILSLVTTAAPLTNTAAVSFTFKTAQNISGLGISNFTLVTTGISGAAVTGISGLGSNYTVTVTTGSGNGQLSLGLANDNGISPAISNKPFTSNSYTIDKTPPVIRLVSIPDKPMKAGDTIHVTILVEPDPGNYKMATGNINGLNLTGFTKKNDSSYTAGFIITNGSNDVDAANNIPLSLSLTDTTGNTSALFQSPIIQSSDPIDANKPFINRMVMPPNALYKAGDTLDFIFRFNEKVILTSTGAAACFSVTVGTHVRTAVYAAGSGSDSLVFRYIVQNGESDKDGIKISNPVTLMNVEIKDLIGNTGSLVFTNPPVTKNIIIDAVAPVISSVATPVAAVYKTGNIFDFLINYSKKVTVTFGDRPPSLPLSIGSLQRAAEYISGSGSNSLLFRYTIQADDMDKDGIKLPSPLTLNTANIQDDAGNHASLTLNNIGALSNIIVNPVTAAVNKITAPAAAIYSIGDTLEFSVGFTEKIFVGNGSPSLKLTIGSALKNVFYNGGSGSNTLLFLYAIQPGDEDTNGIKLNATISLNNASINDEKGNAVPLSLNAIPVTSGILIDAVPPSVKTVSVPGKKIYIQGDTLDFTASFTEPVNVVLHTDTPYIRLLTGTVFKKINYVTGSGSNALLFRYIIQKNDLDKDGIKLDSSIIISQTGITDLAGNPSVLGLKSIGSLSNIKIDAVAPSFTISNTAEPAGCENTPAFPINEILAINDEETGETLTWRVIGEPGHGTVSKLLFSSTSNGDRVVPANILYKPFSNYSGEDTMLVEATDGVNTVRKKITVTIQPAVKNNSIGPSQIICTNNFPATISGTIPSGGNGMYQLAWEYAAGTDSAGFSKATGSNNQQHYTPAQLSSTTWFRRKVVSGECMDISRPAQVLVLKTGLWTGSVNSDWNNANNWCNGTLPGKETDVWISGNTLYDPVIKDTAWCNQLLLFNNTHITVNGVLVIKTNINAAVGAVDARQGAVIYNGITQQTISPAFFTDRCVKKLVINNPGGASLQDDLFITGTLLLNSGSLITNDHLTIQYTATIGPSATGTMILGNITMEHFIKGGKRAFRLLGHPFGMHAGLEMIKDSVDITGNGGAANGFTNTVTNQPSAFRYDPIAGSDSLGMDAGWTAFTSINDQGENSWKEFSGIRLFVRGRPGQGLDATPVGDGKNGTYLPYPVILSMSGPVHTGNQEIVLNKGKNATYHVIANPYPCPVDLSLVTRGNNISQNYWVWNPLQATNGGYSSIPFKSKYFLPPFGAFIAKLNGDINNSLLFTENCKVKEAATDSLPLLTNYDDYFVELRLETDSIFWDRVLLFAIDSAKNNADKNDAEKFINPEVNFYSLSRDQKMLSIDARPMNNETSMSLGLQTNAGNGFSIRVAKLLLPPSSTLQLHDKYLNRWMKLEKDSSYSFIVTADTASQGNERFEISSKKLPAIIPGISMTAKLSPVPATDQVSISYHAPEKGNGYIRISNLNGTIVKTIALGYQKEGQATIPVGDLPKGIYLVEIRCGDNSNTQKMIKE